MKGEAAIKERARAEAGEGREGESGGKIPPFQAKSQRLP